MLFLFRSTFSTERVISFLGTLLVVSTFVPCLWHNFVFQLETILSMFPRQQNMAIERWESWFDLSIPSCTEKEGVIVASLWTMGGIRGRQSLQVLCNWRREILAVNPFDDNSPQIWELLLEERKKSRGSSDFRRSCEICTLHPCYKVWH